MRTALFCLFAFIAIAFAQTEENEVKFIIDTFQQVTPTIVILIPSGGIAVGENQIREVAFVSGNGIMGGERDIQLTVGSGDGNLVLSTGVSEGVYTAATPNEARGNSLLQLDGADLDIGLNPSGLFGHPSNDFTAENAFALRVLIESDLPGQVVFRVISGSVAATCSITVNVPGDDQLNEYILPYNTWDSQACDFSNVGAVEIFIIMDDNIDVLIQDFSTWGPVVRCVCVCPAFTCNLLLDLDDDYFSYYLTSDFGNFNNNPTTDFSTLYTPGNTNSFTTVDTTDLSTFFTFITGITTVFSTGFTTIGSISFSTGFTSIFSTGFSSLFSTDFSITGGFSSLFTSFTSQFSSFTSFTSFGTSFTSFGGSSSSSSSASALSAGFALVSMAVVALF